MHAVSPNGTAQNYTTAALQQRIWKRSTLQGIFINRQAFADGDSQREDYGRNLGGEFNYSTADGKWTAQAAYLKSFQPGVSGRDGHLYGNFFYNGQNFRTFTLVQRVGTNYFADVGFNNRVQNFNPETNEIVRLGYTQVSNNLDYYYYPESGGKVNFHWSGLENYV
ncbi:MAG: hypothetical protein AAFN92_14685, partial [Bacteroidota bacterium]